MEFILNTGHMRSINHTDKKHKNAVQINAVTKSLHIVYFKQGESLYSSAWVVSTNRRAGAITVTFKVNHKEGKQRVKTTSVTLITQLPRILSLSNASKYWSYYVSASKNIYHPLPSAVWSLVALKWFLEAKNEANSVIFVPGGLASHK